MERDGNGLPPGPGGTDEAHRQLAMAFDSAPVGMAVTTETGRLVQVNSALGDLLGYHREWLLGRRLEDVAAPDVAESLSAGRARMVATGLARHVTGTFLRRADGRSVPVSLSCARIPATARGHAYLVVHVQDVSERRAAEAELTRQLLHDPLTGLPNRTLLVDRLTRALTRLQRHPTPVAVLFLDLDGFKAVNDDHGHAAGDQVLVAVARRLRTMQRPGDTACRFGGDEFVVLCEDSGRAQALSVARRVHAALGTPIRWEIADADADATGEVTLTASIGIAATSDPSTTAEQLLHDADTAMYRAKQG
jgi:diguanylate cyclase (GGDEF)-like protein/PAS domain S-box-containing protein